MMQGKLREVRGDALQLQLSGMQNNLRKDVVRLEQMKKTRKQIPSPSNPNKTWTDSYKHWEVWEDEDELQDRIKVTQRKLSKLSSRMEMPTAAKGCCRSNAEIAVARMSLPERLKKMKGFREAQGNRCFKKGDYESALKWYEKSLLFYEYCLPGTKEEQRSVDKERELCLINSAACHLGLQNYWKCVDCCNEALEISKGGSVKAFYRRAKAFRFMCNFDKATNDLEVARGIVCSNNAAAADTNDHFRKALDDETQILNAAIATYRGKSKSAAKKMMKASD
jgi:tetratricopeptide (TPR) repeat protein